MRRYENLYRFRDLCGNYYFVLTGPCRADKLLSKAPPCGIEKRKPVMKRAKRTELGKIRMTISTAIVIVRFPSPRGENGYA